MTKQQIVEHHRIKRFPPHFSRPNLLHVPHRIGSRIKNKGQSQSGYSTRSKHLPGYLNAETDLGTIPNPDEAPGYVYLRARMLHSPGLYDVDVDYQDSNVEASILGHRRICTQKTSHRLCSLT
ncbi:uncharacterized protein EV420DRAFT_1646799 [Desarmillaria tabescens]|uniref:Uncharacterized protein n=1 Tax=Armillaria tabescens TaxID=1929756 RepID=A0AA39MWN3_ARMTA|nr:uncharacterized protein EV420DRAFT_1646799 [Desarmillaria tabescens]KAK0449806.1 hypothetical protein EV420DRAFT_1646799 [Desarmillaria tabescens]